MVLVRRIKYEGDRTPYDFPKGVGISGKIQPSRAVKDDGERRDTTRHQPQAAQNKPGGAEPEHRSAPQKGAGPILKNQALGNAIDGSRKRLVAQSKPGSAARYDFYCTPPLILF